jgi:hypothetical protein
MGDLAAAARALAAFDPLDALQVVALDERPHALEAPAARLVRDGVEKPIALSEEATADGFRLRGKRRESARAPPPALNPFYVLGGP